ncbi:MAG: hypothetical protein ABW168_29840 [Sedimenticola sp.]
MLTLPIVFVAIVCVLVLVQYKNKSFTPHQHCCEGHTERSILSANILSTIGVAILWTVFFFPLKGWGAPAFIGIAFGICLAHVVYLVLLYRGETRSSMYHVVLNKKTLPSGVLILHIVIILVFIFAEIAGIRIYLTEFANYDRRAVYIPYLSGGVIAIFALLYTMKGGLRAVLETDDWLMFLTILIFVSIFGYLILFQSDGVGQFLGRGFSLAVNDFSLRYLQESTVVSALQYVVAALSIVGYYLIMPDYWQRNLLLSSEKRSKRRNTIILSCVINLCVLAFIYALAIQSRNAMDVDLLVENFVQKPISMEGMWAFVSMDLFGPFVVIWLFLIGSISSIDSILIGLVFLMTRESGLNLSHDNKEQVTKQYNKILKLVIGLFAIIYICSFIPNPQLFVIVSLFFGSLQTPLLIYLFVARCYGEPDGKQDRVVFIAFIGYLVMVFFNWYCDIHVYYLVYGFLSGIIVYFALPFVRQMEARG